MYKITFLVVVITLAATSAQNYAENESILLLQEYVRINTTSRSNLDGGVQFWTRLASAVNVSITVQEFTAGYPVIVLTWPGSDPTLTGIMLNSHMDVVPANQEDGWTYPPFSAELDSEGVMWGRGTQDMKSVAIQQYSALKNLAANESTLLRNVYMTIMPDEEIGGRNGMLPFLDSDLFKSLNIGFELDEGAPRPQPDVEMFYQDKVVWQLQIDCNGPAGHSSRMPQFNTTAVGKCLNVANLMAELREEEYTKSLTAPSDNAGVYTSININILRAGTVNNVIPPVATIICDIRLGTTVNETELQTKLENLIHSAGDNITITYVRKNAQSPATVVNDSNPYLKAILDAAQETNFTILPVVPTGATDARFVRLAKIPAFGISPMPNTPYMLHTVDERLNASTFLIGINFFTNTIRNIANLASDVVSPDPSVYVVDTQGN